MRPVPPEMLTTFSGLSPLVGYRFKTPSGISEADFVGNARADAHAKVALSSTSNGAQWTICRHFPSLLEGSLRPLWR